MMIERRLLIRLTEKKARLDALRPLPVAALQRLREQISIEMTYHSNAIEGSTLTLQETRLILETGLTIGGKSLREHFEVINHQEALTYVEQLADGSEAITPFHVRQIHKLVLTRIDDESAGQYRSLSVRIAGASHQPPDAWEVSHRMAEWDEWLQGPAKALHPIERAALAHYRLAAIHPFIDGNGRTARLVMNLLLIRDGYPPTIILRTNRQQYYRVLSHADRDRPVPLVNFVARAVERSLNLYLEACTPTRAPRDRDDEWITLGEAALDTPYSQEYLSLLVRLGRLEAVKRGRNWVTTRRAVAAYRRSMNEER